MAMSNNGISHLATSKPASAVLAQLLAILQAKAITLFTVVDHSGEAAKVGLTMPDTKLVIFGNPQAGTPVMLAAPDSALDLPLKILIAEQSDGTTRISYNSPGYLQSRHNLDPELAKRLSAVEQLATAVAA